MMMCVCAWQTDTYDAFAVPNLGESTSNRHPIDIQSIRSRVKEKTSPYGRCIRSWLTNMMMVIIIVFFFYSVISLRFFTWHGHCLFFRCVSLRFFLPFQADTQTCELVFILLHIYCVRFELCDDFYFGVQMNILHTRALTSMRTTNI